MKTIILTLLILMSLAVHSRPIPNRLPGKILCGKNEITDWTLNSTTPQNRECLFCPSGYGLTCPSGGVRKDSLPIRCERCKPGKTFSNSCNTDMCSPCTNCALRNRKVLDTCIITMDTVCGGCEDGYFESRNESTGNNTCEKCSRCCDDGKDNKIQECIDQGLQSSGQVCSVFDKERCKTKPTRNHQESPTNMTHHNDTLSTTSTTTHFIENEQGASNVVNVAVTAVITVIIVIILGVVVALIAWYWWKKKKKKKKKKTVTNGYDDEHGGNETMEPLIGKWFRDTNGSNNEQGDNDALELQIGNHWFRDTNGSNKEQGDYDAIEIQIGSHWFRDTNGSNKEQGDNDALELQIGNHWFRDNKSESKSKLLDSKFF